MKKFLVAGSLIIVILFSLVIMWGKNPINIEANLIFYIIIGLIVSFVVFFYLIRNSVKSALEDVLPRYITSQDILTAIKEQTALMEKLLEQNASLVRTSEASQAPAPPKQYDTLRHRTGSTEKSSSRPLNVSEHIEPRGGA